VAITGSFHHHKPLTNISNDPNIYGYFLSFYDENGTETKSIINPYHEVIDFFDFKKYLYDREYTPSEKDLVKYSNGSIAPGGMHHFPRQLIKHKDKLIQVVEINHVLAGNEVTASQHVFGNFIITQYNLEGELEWKKSFLFKTDSKGAHYRSPATSIRFKENNDIIISYPSLDGIQIVVIRDGNEIKRFQSDNLRKGNEDKLSVRNNWDTTPLNSNTHLIYGKKSGRFGVKWKDSYFLSTCKIQY